MKLTCKQLDPHACKTYLIGLEGAKEVALIDPVIDQQIEKERIHPLPSNDFIRLFPNSL